MKSINPVIAFLILCVPFVVGCSGFKFDTSLERQPMNPIRGRVGVRHWLEPSIDFELTLRCHSLASVLAETKSLKNQTAKRKITVLAIENNKNPLLKAFQENCIVVIRSGRRLYFPTSMLSLQEVAGLNLKPGDIILTVPLVKTSFAIATPLQQKTTDLSLLSPLGTEANPIAVSNFEIDDFLSGKTNQLHLDKLDSSINLISIFRRDTIGLHQLILPTIRTRLHNKGGVYEPEFVGYVHSQIFEAKLRFQENDILQYSSLRLLPAIF